MTKKNIVFIKSNLMSEETRRPKEIAVLKNIGHKITCLSWNRFHKESIFNKKPSSEELFDEISLNLKSPWGIRALFFLPLWWAFVFLKLITIRWDAVQVLNFDSLPPAIIASKIKRKPIVYEILDTFEDQKVLPEIIRSLCIHIDKFFMLFVNAVVIVDDEQIKEFDGIPNSNVITIYDSPPDILIESHKKSNEYKEFTLFYAGVLNKDRQLNLDKIIMAIENIEKLKLIISGYGDEVKEIEEKSRQTPYTLQFIGKINYQEAIRRSLGANLLFVLRDSIVPVNKHICGSKLLEAMMCGKPILVNKGSSTANKVLEENCGLIVDAKNIEEIKDAIIKLKNNSELCYEMGMNGRKAYEQRYNWSIMELKLLNLYKNILCD